MWPLSSRGILKKGLFCDFPNSAEGMASLLKESFELRTERLKYFKHITFQNSKEKSFLFLGKPTK